MNELGLGVAWGIYHSINADFIENSDDMPLGDESSSHYMVATRGGRPIWMDILCKGLEHL